VLFLRGDIIMVLSLLTLPEMLCMGSLLSNGGQIYGMQIGRF